jgi:hypothetical protein
MNTPQLAARVRRRNFTWRLEEERDIFARKPERKR